MCGGNQHQQLQQQQQSWGGVHMTKVLTAQHTKLCNLSVEVVREQQRSARKTGLGLFHLAMHNGQS